MKTKPRIKLFGKTFDRRWLWINLALLALLLRVILAYFPQVCEDLYSRGLFLVIRFIIDSTLGLLPFATIYLLLIYLGYKVARAIGSYIKFFQLKWRKTTDLSVICFAIDQLFSLVAFLAMSIFLFFFMWAYNYQRLPLEQQLGLEIKTMTADDLALEAKWIMNKCTDLRAKISNSDTSALDEAFFPDNLEKSMRQLLVEELERYNYPTLGAVRGRSLYPKGILLGFQASGVYIPFTGEGHIDAGLHILQKPFTVAHELAHGYGFGDEAVCNFWAYITCIASDNPAIQYVGYLTYWRYVFSELGRINREQYLAIRATLPKNMDNDLQAVYQNNDQYPDFFNTAPLYATYLASQGVKEGIRSYNRMVLLIAEWRKHNQKQ